jgi:hypothetical protein
MDAVLRKLVNVVLKAVVRTITEHSLNYPQISFVVDFRSIGEGLERLDNLNSDPVILVLNFSYNNFFESLETSLFGDGQHAVVPYFKLVSIDVCKLQLRLLLFVETSVKQLSLLIIALLNFLSRCVMTKNQGKQKLFKVFVLRVGIFQKLVGYC